jgi:predicted HTH domain antitoxin
MQIEIPDAVLTRTTERELRLNAACAMYAAAQLTLGQAAEVAGISQVEMQLELGRREIPAKYDSEDLATDLKAADELARR